MNFTQNILIEDDDEEINFIGHPEIFINRRFYGNQSVQNLTDLKLKIHNVLNSRKENFNEQEVKKLSDDVQKTTVYNHLKDVVESFSCPSMSIANAVSNPFTSFTYNPQKESFIIGFENGKIGLGKLSQCRTKLNPLSESNMEQTYFILNEKEVDPNQKIKALNLIKNDLFILTEKKLLHSMMVSHNQITSPKEIFKLSNLKDFKKLDIHSVIFKENHRKMYLMSYKTDKNEMFLAQVDLKLQNTYKTVKIKLDATFFEIDNKDPDFFYFIMDNVIYKMDFTFQESTFGGIFGGNNTKKDMDPSLYGAKEFFRSKFMLEFVRFDEEMKHFFINEGKDIIMYAVQKFEVKKIFNQPHYSPIQVFFSKNMEYLYSFHSEGHICIWDMESENLLNILQGGDNQELYQDPQLINIDKNVGVLHPNGIDVWQLETPKIENNIMEKSRHAKLHFLEDGKHFMLDFETTKYNVELNMEIKIRKLYLLETDTFKIIEEFTLPENTLLYQQMLNGDLLLVLENPEYNEYKAKEYKMKRVRELNDDNLKSEMMFARDLKKDDETYIKQKDLIDEIRNVVNSKRSFSRSQQKIPSRKNVYNNSENLNTNTIDFEKNNLNIETQENNNLIVDNSKNEFEEKKKKAQMIMNNLGDSEDEGVAMNNYNVNSIPNESKLGTKISMMKNEIPNFEGHYLNNSDDREFNTHSLVDNDAEYVQMKIGENLYKQPIDKEIYKYRIVKLVLEIYQMNNKDKKKNKENSKLGKTTSKILNLKNNFFKNSDNEKGLFTLFQTDSEISTICSYLVEIEKDESKGGNTDNFKRLQSKLKQNSPYAGNRNHVMVVSLSNNDTYKIYYKTNKSSIPITNKTIIERIYKEKMVYITKKNKKH